MIRILVATTAVSVASLIAAPAAAATPLPGCYLEPSAYNWYNPCSGQAPWNQSNYSGTNGVPGQYGPNGYTADTGQPGGPQWCFEHTGSFTCP
ncbi:hypothetical protein EV580_1287 [Mycobacterium sp. BK086]|uniref:hypothetical protein n=1 Tax=Mycobacterium sp. BK086 TaxID=2512165 RepID=UPI00105FF9B1|nr:hypothetical protein [Mycobacterium sp. BK086]TDO18106.1 hypothetical protein EV580_1287 [Mycobacterium sp. BK086]